MFRFKKLLSLLLAAVMLVGVVPLGTMAKDSATINEGTDENQSICHNAIGDIGICNDEQQNNTRYCSALVLVFDCSGSMGFCAECGQSGAHDSNCSHYDSENNSIIDSQTRLYAAKIAALNLLINYAGDSDYLIRMFSIASFADSYGTVLNWVNVAGGIGNNQFDVAMNAIWGLNANGGTNLEGGLYSADNLLNAEIVSQISAKNTILLTDGRPTYSMTGGNGYEGSAAINAAAAAMAASVKQKSTLFTICYYAEDDLTYSGGPTAGEFLANSIATSPEHAFNADNADNLEMVYEAINDYLSGEYCTVRFDLNYDNNNDYSTRSVHSGDFVIAPDDPHRDGYIFSGWYPNSECRGFPWYNSHNNYYGEKVCSQMVLYAKWVENSFSIADDWYNFTNSTWSFFGVADEFLGYVHFRKELIWGEYYNAIDQLITDKLAFLSYLWGNWDGSCYGMSCLAALIKAGRIDPSFFDQDAQKTRDFSPPKSDYTVANLIEYYHSMQKTPMADSVYIDGGETINCRRIIHAIDSSEYPVVINFEAQELNTETNEYERRYGHSVLALGYTLTDTTYKIKIADPCNKSKFIFLEITRDSYENNGFSDSEYDNRPSKKTFLQRAFTVEENIFDYQNIQEYLIGKGYFSGSEARSGETLDSPKDECGYTSLTTNFDSFIIEKSSGEYAVVECGYKTAGTLSIGNGQCTNEYGFERSLDFSLPILAVGETYTITPEECLSVVTDLPLEYYSALILQSNTASNFSSQVKTAGNIPITISYDGSVTTISDSPVIQEATVIKDDMTSNWFAVDIVTEATRSLRVTPGVSGVEIQTSDNAACNITVQSLYNDLSFDNINCGATGVTVTEDTSGTTKVIRNGNGVVAATGVFGNALIFCTMGADLIETQAGIPSGGTAVRPADPIRPGLIFGGWYTTYECEDGTEWSFNTPITEDTFIYAKWIVNDDYIHVVSFHTDNNDDVSYLVVHGEALTEYNLPEIPEREGYICEGWPEFDVSCVTEDMVIEPIYTPDIVTGTCGANGDNVTWKFSAYNGKLTICGTGEMADYSGNSMSNVNAPWLQFHSSINTVVIEDGVTTVGNRAFYNYNAIKAVYIGNSVTRIGIRAFYACHGIESVYLGNSVSLIDEYAFDTCTSLATVVIPNSVISIGKCVFAECTSLTSITIPSSVTSIGTSAFIRCSSLTNIDVASANQNYKSVDGVLFDKAGTTLITCPGGKAGEYSIPSSVTCIGEGAFYECGLLTSVTIPSGVTKIDDFVFDRCSSLASIAIPNNVTSIGQQAFSSCSSLTSVTIPDSVTSIGNYAFSNCSSLTSIYIGSGARTISSTAFYHSNSLVAINVASSNTYYKSSNGVLFNKAGTTLVVYPSGKVGVYSIPTGVTSIGSYAFNGCSSLTAVIIPDSVTSIGNYAFQHCGSLTSSVFLGVPPESFGTNVFNYCASDFTIYYTESHSSEWSPNGEIEWNGYPIQIVMPCGADGENVIWTLNQTTGMLTIIGEGNMADYSSNTVPWYSYCEYIESLEIGDGVTSIGDYAFRGCSSLTSVNIPDSVTRIGKAAFSGCSLLNSISIPDSVTSIGDYAFSSCRSLTTISIPDGVTRIAPHMFQSCVSLTSVALGSGLTSIDSYAFYGCSSLTSITIPNSVTRINSYAFCYCRSLTSITIPGSVTYIGSGAFPSCSALCEIMVDSNNPSYCSIDGVLFNKNATELLQYPAGKNLEEYAIPSSVTSVCSYAFSDCDLLSSVIIPDSVTRIYYSAFSNCDSLTSVYIPDSVTSIGDDAFRLCDALTSVTIGRGVTSIGSYAFAYCGALSSAVFLGAPPASFGNYAFNPYVCFYYTETYASEWSPNGETEWNGYQIMMIGEPEVMPGDVNGDGELSFVDVSALYSILVSGGSVSPEQLAASDANGDGELSFADVSALYSRLLS